MLTSKADTSTKRMKYVYLPKTHIICIQINRKELTKILGLMSMSIGRYQNAEC